MKKFLIAIFIILFSNILYAQQTFMLTLEKSIEIAREKSYSMKMLIEENKIAEYNLKSATSRLKTHITMNLSLPDFSNTILQKSDSTGVFFPVKQLNYSSGLTINQPLPTDGRIFIQSGLSSFKDFYTGTRSANLNTRLGFYQPLDALYGYSAIKSQLKRSRLAYEQSSKRLRRSELDLIYSVSQSYFNLLRFQRSAEIAHLDLERQTEAAKIAKNKYSAGLIREVDALQMEVDLAAAQSTYDEVLLSQNSATYRFKELIGIELNDSVVLDMKLNFETIVVNAEQAVQLALANRLEIRESEIMLEQQKLALKEQKLQGMIRGSLNAYLEKIGIANPSYNLNLNNSINNSYDDFLNRPFSYGVGLTITIPIFDWGENRALVRAAEASLREADYQKKQTERNIETEVRNLAGSINTSLKRLQLLDKTVSVAEKSFQITLQRYSDGDIDSQTLALERNRLNTTYNTHLDAYINYQLSLAELMKQTFYDFRNNKAVE